MQLFEASTGSFIEKFGRLTNQLGAGPSSKARFPFVAFAYAGHRSVGTTKLEAIKELRESAIHLALSFGATADTSLLVQWLANSHTKEALALKAGNRDVAAHYGATRALIERSICAVIGEEIRFDMSYEPLGITLRRGTASLELDLLPDGAKSIISWVADLLMRLDRIPWIDNAPVEGRAFLLLLDEIDVHLHPGWQRKVLPMVQRLFPRAQIIVSTHSPFVVSSVSDAWVYPLEVRDGVATLGTVAPSQAGTSYAAVTRSLFGVKEEFDVETEEQLAAFYAVRNAVLAGKHDRFDQLKALAARTAERGVEVADIVHSELMQVAHRIGRAP